MHGITYSKVCGQIRGYQFGHPDALRDISEGINSYYVNGLSLTYGKNPRKHIWTFIRVQQESENDHNGCLCSNGFSGGFSHNPLSTFIGPHYYCESGQDPDQPEAKVLYPMDPLWDGEQCDSREAPVVQLTLRCLGSIVHWIHKPVMILNSDCAVAGKLL